MFTRGVNNVRTLSLTFYKLCMVIVAITLIFQDCSPFEGGGSSGLSYPTYKGFSQPVGIAIDTLGNLWVTDNIKPGIVVQAWGYGVVPQYAHRVGAYPMGLAIDASGNVWVANSADNSVSEIFYAPGINPNIATYPVGNYPHGIAIDASGHVWVANTGDLNISELSPTGTTIGTYLINGPPSHIAIDASENIWVSTSNNIIKLSSQGMTICTYSAGGYAIAIDASGNVWVTMSNGVTELNPQCIAIGKYPAGNAGIAIDASGNIWVADSFGDTVTELSPAGVIKNTYYRVGDFLRGIAIDNEGNVWVANSADGILTKIPFVAKGPQYFPCSHFTDTSCPQFQGGGNF